MSTELKLFIDGVEVKKGDELIRGSNVITKDNTIIIFDRVNRYGEILDSEGLLWTNYPDYNGTCTEWKRRSLIPKKYAPAIFVFKDDKGNVVSAHLSGELYDSKPSSRAPTPSTVYWPASDYLKDGHYVLPLEAIKQINDEQLSPDAYAHHFTSGPFMNQNKMDLSFQRKYGGDIKGMEDK